MTPKPGASKSDWRRHFREQLRLLSTADRASASCSIRISLEAQPTWRDARAVLLFAPTTDEPDMLQLLETALRSGKIVTLPRHISDTDGYAAARITDACADLSPGRFGILEPRLECPTFPLNELDFALIPGIGFSLDGIRLGRGRGYFDRLLATFPGFKCGVAFDCQIAPELPSEAHDVRLDCILTPTRWHPTASHARS